MPRANLAIRSVTLGVLSLGVNLLNAQQQSSSGSGSQVDTGTANNPAAPLVQVQLQNWYNPTYDGVRGQGNEFLFRPIVPFASKGVVPSSIIRVAIPLLTEPNGRTGIGDTQFIALAFPGHHASDRLEWGIGPVIILPSATNRYAGQGQWQVGPSAVLICTRVPKLLLGVIADNPITVTGERSRAGVNALTLEPLIVGSLPNRFFIRIDPYFQFDWKHHGSAALPVNFGFGRLISIHKQLINAYVQPEFLTRKEEVPGINPPRFTLRLAAHLILPSRKEK